VAAALLVAGCTIPGARAAPSESSSGPAVVATTGDLFTKLPDVVARVEPSVVTIITDDGLGSGVVYRSGGFVVTDAHVVGSATTVQVGLADGSRISGQVLARDTVVDIAVVRTERTDLPPATFQQALPRPGQLVIAVGSPLGLENTVTAGIVSAVNRSLPRTGQNAVPLVDLIQTDAAISPGNSGGGLLDASGAVVGLNEAFIPPQAGAVSLGFAIAAATVVSVADQLIANGKAIHPYLGVAVDTLTADTAKALGLSTSAGALIQDVVSGGPADKAGVRTGDVVTKFNDRTVATVGDFLSALRRTKPGDQATLEVRRGSATQTITVTIGTLSQ
jgi:S1-C subfamily serine protease